MSFGSGAPFSTIAFTSSAFKGSVEKKPGDLPAFTTALDQELCAQNRVYREHRNKDVAILPPVVVPLAKGATRKFMQQLGLNSLQNKFPRIIDDNRRELLRSFAQSSTAVPSAT